MMKWIPAILMLLAGWQASADVIRCTFTEPFYSTTYNSTTRVLRIQGPELNVYSRDLTFQILGAGDFEIRTPGGTRRMKLLLNHQGSDGMSDFIYPYTGKLYRQGQIFTGGCESNYLKKKMPGT